MGGGDKALLEVAGRPLLAWVTGRLRPWVTEIALNAIGFGALCSTCWCSRIWWACCPACRPS
ncbi:MAG: hypothetical protein AAF409_02895 [Pseudomonadota bacterium]